jgi:hypothetical protein
LWIPAYVHHLTDADVHALTEFYRGPLGGRLVAAMSAIQEESLRAAALLGRNAAKRAVREVLGPLPQWGLQHPPQSAPAPSNTPPAQDSQSAQSR